MDTQGYHLAQIETKQQCIMLTANGWKDVYLLQKKVGLSVEVLTFQKD